MLSTSCCNLEVSDRSISMYFSKLSSWLIIFVGKIESRDDGPMGTDDDNNGGGAEVGK